MIDVEQLFLFELIEKGSEVILYGMGKWGRSYLQQITETDYCKVLAFSDKKQMLSYEGIPYVKPENVKDIKSDYVIIAALDKRLIQEIYGELVEGGVSKERIVSLLNRHSKGGVTSSDKLLGEKCKIAFQLEGGIGDYIVQAAFIRKFLELRPRADVCLYCNVRIGKVVFFNVSNIEMLESKDNEKITSDIAIQLRNCANVLYIRGRYDSADGELFGAIKTLADDDETIELNNSFRCKDGTLLRRAELLHQDRYQFLGGKALDLKQEDAYLELNPDFAARFNELSLKNYITINYGADTFGRDYQQTKVWPLRYYGQFVKLFKEKYPDVQIVQIGTKDAQMIEGVDRTVFGEDLFLVEYILKNARFHFDCEGGMVHMATALGTKCVVLFGPTPEFFYGYKKNINIVAPKCQYCMGATEDWMFTCIRGFDEPECMRSITPEMVMEKVNKYLEEQV